MKAMVSKWAELRLIPENEDEEAFLRCLDKPEFRLAVKNPQLRGSFMDFDLQKHRPEAWEPVLNYVTAVAYGKIPD